MPATLLRMRSLRLPRVVCAVLLALCALVCAGTATAQNGTAASGASASAAKLQFYIRLTPPRPTFAVDMNAHEQQVMEAHAAYWADLYKTGKVLIIGPVHDPKGIFGMAIIEVASEAEAHTMAENDPSVKAGINKVEVIPMHVFLRKQ
jgi:uncharacterized protein YciI